MVNRVFFISVLLILSISAAAAPKLNGKAVADTSVIPTPKTQITGRPLADKVDAGTIKKTVVSDKQPAKTSEAEAAAAVTKSKTGGNSGEKSGAGEKTREAEDKKASSGVRGKETGEKAKEAGAKSSKEGGTGAKKGMEKKDGGSEERSVTKKTGTADSKEKGKDAAGNSGKSKTGKTDAREEATEGAAAGTRTSSKTNATPGNKSGTATTAAKKGEATAYENAAAAEKTTASKMAATKTTATKTALTKTTAVSKTTSASKNNSKSKSKPKTLAKGIGIELYQPLAFKYAILLDVPVEQIDDNRLLEVLDRWYGTRYRYGGETRKGVDCSAFTQAFLQSYYDYELPRTAKEQYDNCKHIKRKKLRQGDLVFFNTRGPKGGITHVGVYLINNRFVHSATSTGVRISNLSDDYYTEHYAGSGRIK